MTASQSTPDLEDWLPWLHLLRAVSIACNPRFLVLGACGVLLTAFGWGLASHYLPFAPQPEMSMLIPVAFETEQRELLPSDPVRRLDWFDPRRLVPWPSERGSIGDEFWAQPATDYTGDYAREIDDFTPLQSVWKPARQLFLHSRSLTTVAWSTTQFFWALLVWSWIGGAMCRLAAVQFARHERRGLREALKFSTRQLSSYLCAPLLPLSGVLLLGAGLALLSWVLSLIPAPGSTVLMGLASGIALLVGALMTLLLLGVALGWPLMVAAISTEDSDGFDGLTRAVGLLYDRPWHALGLATLSVLLAMIGATALQTVCELVINVSGRSIALGFGWQETHQLGFGLISDDVAPHLSFAWMWLIIPWLLLMGFGPSFIWVSSTVIYFLLRTSDDGTPLNAVADYRPVT